MTTYWQPVTPTEGDLQYRGLKLPNGMTVLLVHNPTKDGDERSPSAAALSLARGNLSDPWEFPGMAHYCEHMLFLGNEKYPIEGEYRKYLQEHGGGSNASTGSEMTLYKFHIADDYFEGGLDRFLNFFKTPLFTESAAHREVLAVDSEYKRNALSDRIRSFNLIKHLCNREHVFCRFASGNEKSLMTIPTEKGLNLRERLMEFYNTHYSSDIMNLVVVSGRSLDDLEKMVTKEDGFTSVPCKGLTKQLSFPGIPFEKEHLGRFIEYVPLQDSMTLDVLVPVPQVAVTKDPNLRCTGLLVHILGHECTGSLTDVLRSQGLASEVISMSNMKESFGHLKVSFTLTKKGLQNINFIVSCLCRYAQLIESEIDTSCTRIHNERKIGKELLFNHQSKRQPLPLATSLASNLRYGTDPETALSHTYLTPPEFDDFQKKCTRECLSLFKPESMLILLSNTELEGSGRELQTDEWWGVKYTVRDLSDSEKEAMRKDPGLKMLMPEENEWLPKHTNITPLGAEEVNEPDKVVITPSTVLWWKQNCRFATPKCKISISLYTTLLSDSAIGSAVGELATKLFIYTVAPKYYHSEDVSHYTVHLDQKNSRLVVSATGFADVVIRLSKSLALDLLSIEFDEQSFSTVKDELCRDYSNSNLETTSAQASRVMSDLLLPLPGHDAVHSELQKLTFTQFNAALGDIRAACSAELKAFGSITKEESISLATDVSNFLQNKTTNCKPPRASVLRFEEGDEYIGENVCIHHRPNPENKESAVAVRYQIGEFTFELSARLVILRALLAPRFFTTLRTQEQLGYGVSTGYHCLNDILYLQLNVRSSTDPVEVHGRMDVFLKNFHQELTAMTEDDVASVVKSTIQAYAAPSSNLVEEFNVLSSEINHQVYCWERQPLMLAALGKVTHKDVISLFETFIRPTSWSSPSRRTVIAVYSLTDAHAASFPSDLKLTRKIDGDVLVQVSRIDANHIPEFTTGMSYFNTSAISY